MAGVWFRIEGRVQGVGFRAFVQDLARELGLGGEVWNTRDRAVEVHAFGDSLTLADFASSLVNGPGHIERISRQVLPDQGTEPSEFEIGGTR